MNPEPLRDRRGERLGGYVLEELLGVGAASSVWLGRGERSAVAIRIDGRTDAPDAEARFARIRQLDHPNLLRVYGAGRTAEGEPYFVCELSDGVPLAEKLQRGQPMPLTEAVPVALQLLDGLEHAHRKGLFSLAPQPSGVFLTGDTQWSVKLRPTHGGDTLPLSARLADPEAHIERLDLAHAAPERTVLGRGGAPADVHAVGAMLFHMLTGRPPFDAANGVALARDLLLNPAPGLLSALPLVTATSGSTPHVGPLAGVAAVVDRALQRRPEARFQTAAAMRRALVGVTGIDLPPPTGEIPVAPPPPAPIVDRLSSPSIELRRRSPLPYVIVGALVALVAGALLVRLL